MCVPHRHDLDLNSCINEEVQVYNRKLEKYLKTCENTQIIEIDSNRDLFTEHGLHLNLKGKDQTAKKIVQSIKARWNRKVSDPIMLKDTEEMVEVAQTEVKEVQLTHENQISSNQEQKEDKLPPKRIRKSPNTRHNDFLWLDRKRNH